MPKNSTGLSQPAYTYLLNLIMTKRLMPGERIPETAIAKEFGISRTPVRDAMRQLANEGLIEIFPNRFAQVTEYSPNAILEIGTLRVALDTMSIKLALLYGSKADFLELRKIAEQCRQAAQSSDKLLRLKADSDFHLELAKISKNSLLMKFQTELYMRVQFIMLHHPNLMKSSETSLEQHFDLAQALMDHDEPRAISIILDHLMSFYNLKDHYPENFFNLPFLPPTAE